MTILYNPNMISDFFGGNFSPSCEKEFWKRNILSQVPCGFEKKNATIA